ncbi:MAG: CRP/FNR family cyclic AMP-dependent transcriptional regulator [Gammaproteobacteria bacterium]|jgi:CRP/FNR family cyclic AMP-dependent transcriptional regulator
MEIKDLSDFKSSEIDQLMFRVPFFKELKSQTGGRLDVLLESSCVVELQPGEIIMQRGDRGSWLYFLIKGSLAVFLDDPKSSKPISHITPGELFGDLALLCDHERKATVAADEGEKNALLFAIDFKPFGDLLNFNTVDLVTKLAFYQTMVHSIRWRLEVSRMSAPAHPLAMELRKVPTFKGEKNSGDELQSLHEQAQFLASMLDRWNSSGN